MQSNTFDRRGDIRLKTQLLVVGGGAAGVAAATVAARRGLKVTMIERYGFCGGGAVAGLSGTVCGLYFATNNNWATPEQAVFGFADEFVRALEQRGGLAEPVQYGKTFTRVHDPLKWRETADTFVTEAGVEVLFHTVVTGVILEGERVVGVQAYTKEGPLAIEADVTIDASGDADLVAMAGFPSFMGHNGTVQNPTMIFRLGGCDVDAFRAAYGADTILPVEVSNLILEANKAREFDLPRTKIWLFPTTHPNELLCNCTRIVGPDGRELNTLRRADFTDAEIEGRKQVRQYAAFFKKYLTGLGDSFVFDTGVQVGVRQTRQAEGVAKLMNQDVLSGKKSPNGIARSPWPIELHAGERPKVEWLIDDYYEVPFECFVPQVGDQLLVAGRCLSAEHEAVASARVTAQCFSYGHAAGIAAATSIQNSLNVRQMRGEDIRVQLNQDGARLD